MMKELRIPWNNWHSRQSLIDYLMELTPADRRWPVVAKDLHFKDLAFAESLEGAVSNAIRNFNNRRFMQLIQTNPDGKLVIADAMRVLKPLFVTTEINLASARQQSRLHPLATMAPTGPSLPVEIPNSFFLAASTLAKVGITVANEFQAVARIQPADYKAMVERLKLKIKPEASQVAILGDTHFAWFTPELGFVATHWIETLLDNKVLSNAFVAAALGADLERPIFSEERKKLLKFVPKTFTATPDEPHPDALTRAIIKGLEEEFERENRQASPVEAEFLAALKASDPIAIVRARVVAYKNRIAQRLAPDADAGIRNKELEDLFQRLIDRRKAMVEDPVFGNLKESEALLPLPLP